MKRLFTYSTWCMALLFTLMTFQSKAQNNCASPFVIPSIPFSSGPQTTCGTVNDFVAGFSTCVSSSYGAGEDYVYSISITTAPVTYTLTLGGAAVWKIASVHSACPPAGANCVGGIATSSGSSASGNVTFPTNGTYYIIIDTWPLPDCGAFSLDITVPPPPPANDNCAGAIVRVYTSVSTPSTTSNFTICIGTPPPPPANDNCPGALAFGTILNDGTVPISVGASCNFTQYTTGGATGSVGPPAPGCASYSGGDVWFTAVVPAAGRLIIDTNTGVVTDGGMAIYSGNCGVLTLIECDDDDSANGLMPMIDRSGLTPGATIYIRFWEYGNDNAGTFSICVWAPAPPCNAPGTPVVSNITSNSASVSWSAAAGAVSYDWTVGTGGSCPTGTGANTAATSISLNNLIPNTTYRVCVRTSTCGGGSASSYETVTFSTAPLANDACAGAIPLSCNSTVNGSTVGAVSDIGQGSCGSAGTPGNGVWYSLAGDGSQITLDLCGSAYDTKVHVYSGSCAGLSCVISNDDNASICTSATTRSQVVFNTTPGTTYYILVSGFGTTTGAFSMNVGCVCGAPLSFPWSNNAIGANTTGEGIDNVCGGSIDISSNGYSPSLTSDALFLSSQLLCGNQSITVKVQSITNGGFAGIMFRDTVSAGSRFIAIKTQLNPHVFRELRAVANGNRLFQQIPAPGHTWLRLTRSGNTFTGFTSHNGINWNQAFTVNLALNSCVRVGLFAQGLNPASVAQAQFSMITGFQSQVISLPNMTNSINEGIQGLTVFPNPASSELNLKIGTEYLGKNISINVMDQMGRVVLQRNIHELQTQQEQINVSNLPGGLYVISLMTEGQAAQIQKFIVSGNRP
ncbi:MAG: T9SS type A sorting domain-containing protein [Saprospiraceae bacterium]|nr:T9SS type A sorting domain-containing protein [Saprospiraceae bacterium]